MQMSRIILIVFTLLVNFNSTGQKRIGIDISSRLDNLMFTVHYQQVLKNRFLYSVGIFGGGNGGVLVQNDTLRLYSGKPIATPYSNSDLPIIDSITSYSILDYTSSARSVGIQFGVGYYFEFDVEHGLRINLNSKWAYVGTKLGGYYRSIETYREVYATHYEDHFVGSLSLEAFHTIRLSGRMTFNYGFKLPYYYTIDKARFRPSIQKDLLYGFEPEVSIGLTRVIGKCD